MRGKHPTSWSLDNYDGDTVWIEMRMLPKIEYKGDDSCDNHTTTGIPSKVGAIGNGDRRVVGTER